MELDTVYIIEYLKKLTNSLREKMQELSESKLDLSKDMGTGADGEATTYIDAYAEKFLIDGISEKFKCKIMSEEMGIKSFGNDNLLFIIDPVDGTSNAKNRIPFFSCSIAALNNGELIAGLVRDLYNGDCFYAIKGRGSYYNSGKASARYIIDQRKSALLFSRPVSEADFSRYKKFAAGCGGYRILGCPSLEICYVASGKADAAIQIHENPRATIMDIAAAKLILEEAGGVLLNENKQEIKILEDPTYRTNFVACANNAGAKKKIFELISDD